jgi:sarcosine oxidase subunit beta
VEELAIRERNVDETASVVIIGGGISGAAIAYYLAKRGYTDVLLVERKSLGSGSTGAAAGGIRAQFSTEVNVRASILSMPVWDRFEAETGSPHTIVRSGYLLLATAHAEYADLAESVTMQNALGVPSRMVDQSEIQEIVPTLYVDDLAGASFNADDGIGNPYDALQGYVRGARSRGVRVLEDTRVDAIDVAAGRVEAVHLSSGARVVTPVVVNAAGPWAAETGAMAGVDIPVRPFRREIYVSEPFPQVPPGPLVMDLHVAWYYRHEGERILMSGIADPFSSWNTDLDRSRLPEVAPLAVHRLPGLAAASFTSGWAGSYDISPDNHGIIGQFPELKGFVCACGFSGHGYMHSPATGMVVSELILDGTATSLDITALSPTRFREGRQNLERLTSHRELPING